MALDSSRKISPKIAQAAVHAIEWREAREMHKEERTSDMRRREEGAKGESKTPDIVPGACSRLYRRERVRTRRGDGQYWGEMNEMGEAHGWGAIRWDNGDDYDGVFKHGELNGQGTYTCPNNTQYVIEFEDGRPVGKGEMYENIHNKKEMIVYDVEFDGSDILEECEPVSKQRKRPPDYKEAMIPVSGMLAGPPEGPSSGELIWARPSRADFILFNADQCRGTALSRTSILMMLIFLFRQDRSSKTRRNGLHKEASGRPSSR
eukprot:754519-Hanusia_phi.AAC.3